MVLISYLRVVGLLAVLQYRRDSSPVLHQNLDFLDAGGTSSLRMSLSSLSVRSSKHPERYIIS